MTFEEWWGYPRGDLRLCLEKHKTPLEIVQFDSVEWQAYRVGKGLNDAN